MCVQMKEDGMKILSSIAMDKDAMLPFIKVRFVNFMEDIIFFPWRKIVQTAFFFLLPMVVIILESFEINFWSRVKKNVSMVSWRGHLRNNVRLNEVGNVLKKKTILFVSKVVRI